MNYFVGRKNELSQLNQHYLNLENHTGHTLIIQGESGIGKTELVDQFLKALDQPQLYILRFRILADDHNPYSFFTEIIRSFLQSVNYNPEWLIKIIPAHWIPVLTKFIPELDRYYPIVKIYDSPTDDPVKLLPEIFLNIIENLSNYKPVILFFDDIHNIQQESINILKYLSPRIELKPILILGTSRNDSESSYFKDYLRQFINLRLLSLITLDGLKPVFIDEIINEKFSKSIPQSFKNWLNSLTRGNPLFIWEILNQLTRINVIHFDSDQNTWEISDDFTEFPVTQTIESVIDYKFRHLNSEEFNLIQTASVLGEKFPQIWLQALFINISQERFTSLLEKFHQQRIIKIKTTDLEFYHPLIREHLYRTIKIPMKIKIHRQIAQYLEKYHPQYFEIKLYHQVKYLQPDEYSVGLCKNLILASDNILQQPNPGLSLKYLVIAQEISKKFPQQLDIEATLIKAKIYFNEWLLGKEVTDQETAEKFAQKLIDFGRTEQAALLYRYLFLRKFSSLKLNQAQILLDKGLDNSNEKDSVFWVLKVDQGMLWRRKGFFRKAETYIKEIINNIDPEISPQALYNAYQQLFILSHSRGDFESAYQFIKKSKEIIDWYNLNLNKIDIAVNLSICEVELGKFDQAIPRLYKVLREIEIERRIPHYIITTITLAQCLVAKGEYLQVLELIDNILGQADQISLKRMKIIALLTKAECLIEISEKNRALEELSTIEIDQLDPETLCLFNILKAKINFILQNYQKAEEHINQADKLAQKSKLIIMSGKIFHYRSLISLKTGNREKGINYWNKAKKIFEKGKSLPNLADLNLEIGLELKGIKGKRLIKTGIDQLVSMNSLPKLKKFLRLIEPNRYSSMVKEIQLKLKSSSYEKIKICTLGGLKVILPPQINPIPTKTWKSVKAREMLGLTIVLSLKKQTTREIIGSYLWPEMNPDQIKKNFRFTLSRMTTILGSEAVIKDGDFLYLNREKIWVDIWNFQQHYHEFVNSHKHSKYHLSEKHALAAKQLYQGDFLPEFYNSPIDDQRIHIQQQYYDILVWLAKRAQQRLEWKDVLNYAYNLIQINSLDETAYYLIMSAHLADNNKSRAIQQFYRYQDLLYKEYKIKPGQEITNLFNRIKDP